MPRKPSRKRAALPEQGLVPYFAVADGLALLFSPFVEVVVHDLAQDCVAHVANPLSPREAGDPSGLKEIRFDADQIGPYEKINFDGRRIKTHSVVLRGRDRKPLGLLCINADVTAFDAARRMLQGFLGVPETLAAVEPAFRDDWHEKINRFVAAWAAERRITLDRLDRDGRRDLIAALHEIGGFEGRRAATYVATILGVSRATIYNELALVKQGLAA
jgi:predicted transcriptional regulator YheO